jgi:uncharacterized protein
MHSWLDRLALGAFTILLGASLSAGADLEAGKRAFKERDFATAFKELSPLAEQGNAEAQAYLGKMYLMGQGVEKDRDRAIKLFKESATQGNADAEFMLGSLYLLPHENIPEGLKLLRLSADQGNQDAQLLLGKAYMDGNDGLPRDPVQADMWMRLAAKDNLPFYKLQLQTAERQMNATQIVKGKAAAEAWKPKAVSSPAENKQ